MSNQCCEELTAKIKEYIKDKDFKVRDGSYNSRGVYVTELLQFLDTLNEVVGLPNTSQVVSVDTTSSRNSVENRCSTCGAEKCKPSLNYIDRNECDNWTPKEPSQVESKVEQNLAANPIENKPCDPNGSENCRICGECLNCETGRGYVTRNTSQVVSVDTTCNSSSLIIPNDNYEEGN